MTTGQSIALPESLLGPIVNFSLGCDRGGVKCRPAPVVDALRGAV